MNALWTKPGPNWTASRSGSTSAWWQAPAPASPGRNIGIPADVFCLGTSGRGRMRQNISSLDGYRLQLLIDAVVDYAIYMIDPEGRVLSWNSGGIRLKGYSADEIIGRHFSEFYTPEDRAAGLPAKAVATARESGRFHGEGWRVRKDGTRFWALVVVDAIRDTNGTLGGFAKVTRDITERQQAQLTLLESERRYRRRVESVVDYAIFQLDPAGNI